MIGLWETVICSWALRFLTLKMSLAAHNAKFILANGQLDQRFICELLQYSLSKNNRHLDMLRLSGSKNFNVHSVC